MGKAKMILLRYHVGDIKKGNLSTNTIVGGSSGPRSSEYWEQSVSHN